MLQEEHVKNLKPLEVVNEGKSKIIYSTNMPGVFLMKMKPHLRSITYKREGNIPGTEYWRMLATLDIMLMLEFDAVPTNLQYHKVLKIDGELYLVVGYVEPIPIEFICRYIAAGSITRLFPTLVKEGDRFNKQLQKYDLKQDVSINGVDDPTLNESYIVGLDLMSQEDFNKARNLLYNIGELLRIRLDCAGMDLVDIKMEFGKRGGKIVLLDEISQDCTRARDKVTGESKTKDAYREGKTEEEVLAIYREFALRLNPYIENCIQEI